MSFTTGQRLTAAALNTALANNLTAATAAGTAAATTAINAALAPSTVSTSAPTTGDDSADGNAVFSAWQNTAKRAFYLAADVSVGAAKWPRLALETRVPPIVGRLYPCYAGPTLATIVVPAVDRLFLVPFEVFERETITALSLYVQTAGTGSSVKMCLYASANSLPSGAPLASDTTGISTASTGSKTFTFSNPVTLEPGIYWVGHKDTGTLPEYVSIASQNTMVSAMIGRSALNAQNNATALYIADTYSATFPTMTGSESYTDNVNGGTAVIYRTVA